MKCLFLLAVSAIALVSADPGRSVLSTAGGQRSSDLLSSRARRSVQPLLRSAPIADPSPQGAIYAQAASDVDEKNQSPFCLDVGFVSTIVRALLMCAAVILTQTIGAASWMSPSVQSAVAAFSQWRSNNQLAVTSITAFFLYFSSDALSQCALSGDRAASTSSEDGSRRIQLDIARMARSGFTSALLSGFLACFYFAWLDRTPPPRHRNPQPHTPMLSLFLLFISALLTLSHASTSSSSAPPRRHLPSLSRVARRSL